MIKCWKIGDDRTRGPWYRFHPKYTNPSREQLLHFLVEISVYQPETFRWLCHTMINLALPNKPQNPETQEIGK